MTFRVCVPSHLKHLQLCMVLAGLTVRSVLISVLVFTADVGAISQTFFFFLAHLVSVLRLQTYLPGLGGWPFVLMGITQLSQ